MAAAVPQYLRDLRLCAKLADYAYASGKPELSPDKLPKDVAPADLPAKWAQLSDKWPEGYKRTDLKRETFYTDSWFKKRGTQHRFFKSHAYVCSLEETNPTDSVKRVVVGFRGTWLQPGEPNEGVEEKAMRSSFLSTLYNIPFSLFAPSNYGLADIYYDATLIRVPYRTGVVWKWYTYWGTLILGGSDRFRPFWGAPRRVAAGLISRPRGVNVADKGNLLVHLGFWALWASAEGFAGYDRFGKLREDEKTSDGPISQGVMQSVFKKVRDAKGQQMEILVVGHSLGGAVSCFAALDIIAELDKLVLNDEDFKKVKVIHATFAAPPVGTAAFAAHFNKRTEFHKSYAVIHERDVVPKCFAWCRSSNWPILRWLRWLGWWNDWSRVGKELVMREELPSEDSQDGSLQPRLADRPVSNLDKLKASLVVVGAIGFVGLSQLAVPLSMFAVLVCWLVDKTASKKHYGEQTNPPDDWKSKGPWVDGRVEASDEDKKLEHVGIEYHSLQKYITLLDLEDPFQENVAGATERG